MGGLEAPRYRLRMYTSPWLEQSACGFIKSRNSRRWRRGSWARPRHAVVHQISPLPTCFPQRIDLHQRS